MKCVSGCQNPRMKLLRRAFLKYHFICFSLSVFVLFYQFKFNNLKSPGTDTALPRSLFGGFQHLRGISLKTRSSQRVTDTEFTSHVIVRQGAGRVSWPPWLSVCLFYSCFFFMVEKLQEKETVKSGKTGSLSSSLPTPLKVFGNSVIWVNKWETLTPRLFPSLERIWDESVGQWMAPINIVTPPLFLIEYFHFSSSSSSSSRVGGRRGEH